MDGLTSAHLVFLGLWGGVIAAEMTIEIAGAAGKLERTVVAWLHWQIDRFIEWPLLAAVLATGLLLWARRGWAPELALKVGLGLAAVAANAVCVALVRRRVRHPDAAGLTRGVFSTAFVGVPFGLGALALGGMRAGWW